jgi:hypothetical protein
VSCKRWLCLSRPEPVEAIFPGAQPRNSHLAASLYRGSAHYFPQRAQLSTSTLANTDSSGSMAVPIMEEAKLLSEALNTVKIQVQQMKRHLVGGNPQHSYYCSCAYERCGVLIHFCILPGTGPADGCAEECQLDAGRIADIFAVTKAIL